VIAGGAQLCLELAEQRRVARSGLRLGRQHATVALDDEQEHVGLVAQRERVVRGVGRAGEALADSAVGVQRAARVGDDLGREPADGGILTRQGRHAQGEQHAPDQREHCQGSAPSRAKSERPRAPPQGAHPENREHEQREYGRQH
jgi:hypothetical protein